MNGQSQGEESGKELRVGVDIGGTFTDLIAFDPVSDAYLTNKVQSTPSNPARAVITGLEELLGPSRYSPGDVTVLSHGSTVTVNTLIERTGPKTALLLTEGFDALPVAGQGDRPHADVKNPRYVPPKPLVPQRLVREIPERIDADGTVVEPLDEPGTREVVADLKEKGVDSIAVGFLFSFLNPEHERRVAELVGEIHPECSVSLSSEIAPRIREYPRISTTVVNAYVDPKLTAYLADLERLLADSGVDPEELTVMLSHGGLSSFSDAAERAATTLLSGPAAGVQGALFAARLTGVEDVVTMDMGGTSCDIAIAPDLDPLTATDKEFERNPVTIPMVDIQAIGAGGGTIARVEGDRLQVGPVSAGADPGPICYDSGGERVTITDANVVLGRLNPTALLGGDLQLDVTGAEEAIESRIADPLGLTGTEAAAGIIEVVNNRMKKELSLALTQHGYDPRTFALVAYGGAGPMHAASIARELSLEHVIVPPWPGINSAVGMVTTDRKRLYERSRIDRLDDAPLEQVFTGIESRARADLEESGVAPESIDFRRRLELRYVDQSYELGVAVTPDTTPEEIREAFTEKHREAFGHTSDEPLETMTYRITARIETRKLTGELLRREMTDGTTEEHDTRDVYFDGQFRETPIYRRGALGSGDRFEGPAIVEQMDTTTVVPPGVDATIDRFGNIRLAITGG